MKTKIILANLPKQTTLDELNEAFNLSESDIVAGTQRSVTIEVEDVNAFCDKYASVKIRDQKVSIRLESADEFNPFTSSFALPIPKPFIKKP